MGDSTQVTLSAPQRKKLAEIAKKTGYDIEELLWDAVDLYLKTKAQALSRRQFKACGEQPTPRNPKGH